MDLEKEVFTTFEAAKICNANITSIKNWIEQGEIKAFRTPGGHYRIERRVLANFLERHGMPNPLDAEGPRRILNLTEDEVFHDDLRRYFGERFEYARSADPMDAMLKVGSWEPRAVVIDAGLSSLDPGEFFKRLDDNQHLVGPDIVVWNVRDGDQEAKLRRLGLPFIVPAETDDAELLETVALALE